MATYIQIGSTVTVGSGGASSIDFTSIPSTYTDLVVKISTRTTDTTGGNWGNAKITFNGNTSSIYSDRTVYGTGSGSGASFASTSAASSVGTYDTRALATASTFSNTEIYIPNHAGSNNKSFSTDSVTETNATSAIAILSASIMASATAISSIKIEPSVGTYVQYTTATLYGIKNS
jgi:hypothetical protein